LSRNKKNIFFGVWSAAFSDSPLAAYLLSSSPLPFLPPSPSSSLRYMASEATGQSAEAAKLYEVCVDQCDKKNVVVYVEYLVYLGRAYFMSEQYEKALLTLKKAAELRPEDQNLWFNVAAIQTKYANENLSLARTDTRYLTVALVQKSIDMLKSSRTLFQKAHDAATAAEAASSTQQQEGMTTATAATTPSSSSASFLYDAKTAMNSVMMISKVDPEDMVNMEGDDWLQNAYVYLEGAKKEEEKNQSNRLETLQELKQEEDRVREERERKIREEQEEKEKREQRAREITAKAAEQNKQAAIEAKAIKEKKKLIKAAARSRPKRKRDVGETLGSEDSRSEDSSSSSDSDSSGSDSDDEPEAEMGDDAKKTKGPPAKKRAKLTAAAAAIFSDSDDDSDDEIVGSGGGGGSAGGEQGAPAAPAAPAKGLLDDSDEDD